MEHSSLLKCDTMWSGTGVPMIHRFLLNNGTLPTCQSLRHPTWAQQISMCCMVLQHKFT